MQAPRQIFGAARKIENGGSLTIIGTALIDTGSRMDQVIFEEFKGTGNSEIYLSRELAERRIYPAIDIPKSGTRKEEKLIAPELLGTFRALRRILVQMPSQEAMLKLTDRLNKTKTNEDFFNLVRVGESRRGPAASGRHRQRNAALVTSAAFCVRRARPCGTMRAQPGGRREPNAPRFFVRCALLAACLLSPATTSFAATIPSPSEYLKLDIGADRVLADYRQIRSYFAELDRLSPRVQMQTLGRSTLGEDMVMAVITSEANMARLPRLKRDRQSSPIRAGSPTHRSPRLTEEGRAFLLITCNIHARPRSARRRWRWSWAHALASAEDAETKRRLDEVVLLLVPSLNPDGQIMETEWYRKYLGTPYEGGREPWLYHHYAGHDNNRDWFMLTQSETKAMSRAVYQEWFPQVWLDEHQMGNNGPRIFTPPYAEPVDADIHPLVWREVNRMARTCRCGSSRRTSPASSTATRSTRTGRAARRTPRGSRTSPGCSPKSRRRSSPRRCTWTRASWPEAARVSSSTSARRTSPTRGPAAGGGCATSWTTSASRPTRSSSRAPTCPRPAAQHGRACARVHRARRERRSFPHAALAPARLGPRRSSSPTCSSSTASRCTSPDDDLWVPLAQPYGNFVREMLTTQRYPEVKLVAGKDIVRPYDVAAWSLPLMMGVTVEATVARDVDERYASVARGPRATGRCVALSPNGAEREGAQRRALRSGGRVTVLDHSATLDGHAWAAGTAFLDAKAAAAAEAAAPRGVLLSNPRPPATGRALAARASRSTNRGRRPWTRAGRASCSKALRIRAALTRQRDDPEGQPARVVRRDRAARDVPKEVIATGKPKREDGGSYFVELPPEYRGGLDARAPPRCARSCRRAARWSRCPARATT